MSLLKESLLFLCLIKYCLFPHTHPLSTNLFGNSLVMSMCAVKQIHKGSFFVFTHVGKTGGGSIRAALKQQPLPYDEYHLCQPTQEAVEGKPMMVSVRNPVSRGLSCWNWWRFLCLAPPEIIEKTRRKRSCGEIEKQMFEKCSFTDFVHTLEFPTPQNNTNCSPHLIRHWDQDIRWHLQNLTQSYINTNVWLVDQESMVEDIKEFFDAHSWRSSGKLMVETLQHQLINNDYPKDIERLTPKQRRIFTKALIDEIAFYTSLKNRTGFVH